MSHFATKGVIIVNTADMRVTIPHSHRAPNESASWPPLMLVAIYPTKKSVSQVDYTDGTIVLAIFTIIVASQDVALHCFVPVELSFLPKGCQLTIKDSYVL